MPSQTLDSLLRGTLREGPHARRLPPHRLHHSESVEGPPRARKEAPRHPRPICLPEREAGLPGRPPPQGRRSRDGRLDPDLWLLRGEPPSASPRGRHRRPSCRGRRVLSSLRSERGLPAARPRRLNDAGRLSDRFEESLLSWAHSGFSLYAGPPIPAADSVHIERMARYLTRPPIAVGTIKLTPEGSVLISTPLDPHDRRLREDPGSPRLHPRHHIPDPRQRSALRSLPRRLRQPHPPQARRPAGPSRPPPLPTMTAHDFTRSRRKGWARLLRRILEVDPLLCPQCGVELRIVSVITDPSSSTASSTTANADAATTPSSPGPRRGAT